MTKQTFLRRMKKSKLFIIGCVVFVGIILLCLLSPLYVQHDPLQADLANRLHAPEGFANGLKGYVLGADAMGRDVLTRLLMGGRYSLLIATLTLIPSAFIGIFLGLLAGYYGGMTETVIMRFCDIMMSIPSLMLAVCIVAVLGASMPNLILTLTITSWIVGCRVIRGEVLAIRKSEYVQAARCMGASNMRIMIKEVLPNVVTPAIITESQHFGAIILTEASLGFLGLGIPIPKPSWGTMLSDGRAYITQAPWLVLAPGIVLMLTVLACNFLGTGLRDILDPKNKD